MIIVDDWIPHTKTMQIGVRCLGSEVESTFSQTSNKRFYLDLGDFDRKINS